MYEGVPVIGVYDNDTTGRDGYRQFKNHHNFPDSEFKIIKQDKLFCGMLPLSEQLKSFSKAIEGDVPLPIEFMFPAKVIHQAVAEGVLKLEPRMSKARDKEFPIPVNVSEILGEKLPEDQRYLVFKVNDSSKVSFADWVKREGIENWIDFIPLFDVLLRVCADSKADY